MGSTVHLKAPEIIDFRFDRTGLESASVELRPGAHADRKVLPSHQTRTALQRCLPWSLRVSMGRPMNASCVTVPLVAVCLAVLALLLWIDGVAAQSSEGDKLAQVLRGNVARISAEGIEDGRTWREDGFGFIVAERANRVLLVTANHVVRRRGPGARTTAVKVTFFQDPGRTYPADLLGTHDESFDIAVLDAPFPAKMVWAREASAPLSPARGQSVWYIGRDRDWYIPTVPGRVNNIGLDFRIAIDGLSVRVGASGAPLIAESGIVGMLIEDSPGESTKAVAIDIIRRAFELWNLPWNLSPRGSATSGLVSSSSGTVTPERLILGVHDLPVFRVTIDKITMGTGFNPLVTLFVTYTNKTERELFLGLCGARYERKTLLVDDLGDTFLLDSSNGISDVCFAPTDPPLIVAPRGSTRVALVFNRHSAKPEIGTRFSLTSEHVALTQDTSGKYRIRSKFGVSILEIVSQ